MIKKIILFVFLFGIIKISAQEKIAYLNYSEIIKMMPEYSQVQDSVRRAQISIQNEIGILEAEYKKKYEAFINESNSLVESIKMRRMQEIKDIAERAGLFHEQSQKQLQQTYEQLLAPIHKKVKEAIRLVGKEHNFIYVLEETELLYINPIAINIASFVKQKLKLKK